MRKFLYVPLFGIFLIGIAMLIPQSPVYPIVARYVQKRMESRWNCRIAEKRISADPFAGNVSFEDLRIETAGGANPAWRLQIKRATLTVRYLPLLRDRTIDGLTLDGVDFRQEYTETSGGAPTNESSPQAKRRNSEPSPPVNDGSGMPEGAHIKRLTIRNGSFEYIRIDASGGRQRIQADEISVVRKNVYLDKRPGAFFRSVLNTPD
jgi:hypothetical protein